MKYVCQICNSLVTEPYAVDSDGYFCDEECYHENYEDESEEETQEEITEDQKESGYTPTLDYNGQPKKKSLFGFRKEI